jgi:hypothetical protein
LGASVSWAPDGSEIAPTNKPQADGTQVKALARAWRWRRMLDDGVYTTVSEIGEAETINKSDVSRILRLALLASDIVEVVLGAAADKANYAGTAGATAPNELGGAEAPIPDAMDLRS